MSSVKVSVDSLGSVSASLRSTGNLIPDSLSVGGGSGSAEVDAILQSFAAWSTTFLRARRDAAMMLAANTEASAQEFARAEKAIQSATAGAY